MAPHNPDDSRRDDGSPEHNPFVAFRRFADAQVSSLLHTVFTLPATLAPTDARFTGRPQTPQELRKMRQQLLQNTEDEMSRLDAEVNEALRAGDAWRASAARGELISMMNRKDHIKRAMAQCGDHAEKESDTVERVANEKGQEWAWSWSWGFPQPFDSHGQETHEEQHEEKPRRSMCRWRRRRHRHDEDAQKQNQDEWAHFENRWNEMTKRMSRHSSDEARGHEESSHDGRKPKVWKWSYSWPPRPADAPDQQTPTGERAPTLFEELGNAILDEATRAMLPHPDIISSPWYSPRRLEEHPDTAGVKFSWRDAFEDLIRVERGGPLMPTEQLGQSHRVPYNQWVRRFWQDFETLEPAKQSRSEYPKRVPWEGEETSEDPSYEYAHDHEDQHDDPPTPKSRQDEFNKAAPTTELDAYERLLGPATSVPSEPATAVHSSILSTLTTTERSVAPDGSVTTKVVLKKRFADGREESSETVHTQRGQDTENQVQDPWKKMQQAQFPSTTKPAEAPREPAKRDLEKKTGWFWSN
ncbi:hypothetical protein BCR34DRAFT_605278 [Clohesyomyces aquaticus]|uniref:Uncharacterized protein n=1 Tax=Clohesyomyces aquaticus TaxID=1231657 RepID=A0A1Y1YZ56_9PLEO|nr:hypothetical protein BCR34DRAFT_605278 [Clohesyomyces aquaticus]